MGTVWHNRSYVPPSPAIQSLKQFQALTAQERIGWLNWFMRHYSRLGFHIGGWFNAQEGVIEFGGGPANLIRPGSWFSWVDATILYSIRQGMAIARGNVATAFAGAGALAWANFFHESRSADPDEGAMKHLWGIAEQESTLAGQGVAFAHGTQPTSGEFAVLQGAITYQQHLITGEGPGLLDDLAGIWVTGGQPDFPGGLTYDPRRDQAAISLEASVLYSEACGC